MRMRAATLVLAAFMAVSCSILPPELQRELLPTQTQYRTAMAAFSALIERHVDKPGSLQLANGALDGVSAYIKKANLASDPVVDKPAFTGSTWSDFARLSDAIDAVLRRYPDAKRDLVERAAVDGMARSMNECHTYYVDPDRSKTFNQRPAPVTGIGVTIGQPVPNEPAEIIDVISGTPAERAGVQKGDRFVLVNGEDVSALTTSEIADRVRGPEGTMVSIVLRRGARDLAFTIARARFTVPLFTSRLDDNSIGYLKIPQLISSVADDVGTAARALSDQGARGYILDLRDDPGGELAVAVDVASMFVRQGVLVYQTGRDGQRTPIQVNTRRYLGSSKPLVVLVNKNSASGSEIIAAGIQANDAGTVIGTQTAGCVGTGQPRELPDGGLLLVTLSKMQDAKTLADLNGPGKGVVPDRIVTQTTGGTGDQQLQAATDFLLGHVTT